MNQVAHLLWLLLAFALACPAVAQSGAIISSASGVTTIDASSLDSIVTIDAPWRFEPADQLRFADKGFDDSSWPLARPMPDLKLSQAGLPTAPQGAGWLRLHLEVLNPGRSLSLAIRVRVTDSFAVYANGSRIGASAGFDQGYLGETQPVLVTIPPAASIVLAIRVPRSRGAPMVYFPLEHVEIGGTRLLTAVEELNRSREFEDRLLGSLIIGALFLGFVPIGLTLLLTQPNHSEYFWLMAYCLFSALESAWSPLIDLGVVPGAAWSVDLLVLSQACLLVTGLEFARTLAGSRRTRLILLVQLSTLFEPVFFSIGRIAIAEVGASIVALLWFIAMAVVLFLAFRRGRKECGLLLVTFVFGSISNILGQLRGVIRVPTFPALHIGRIGFGGMNSGVANPLTIVGLIAVVLYRFILVSKDEQLAASELEAARTVQQLLIPATQPATPGFAVASVYIPARQVGGDFFLILPAHDSGDQSLLAIMGDVSGKGLQAAMVVSTIIGGLRMQISRKPAEVLTHLNRMLVGRISGFATCCATLIHSDGRMQIANAGNPSPYSAGEEIATVPGLPLGMVPDAEYQESTYRLAAGKQLTFVSDGVIEATAVNGKELFGFDRTESISTDSAETIANAARAFGAGAPQADDITVLTIRLS